MYKNKAFLAFESFLFLFSFTCAAAVAKSGIPFPGLHLRNATGWYVGIDDIKGDSGFPRSIGLTPNKTAAAPAWIDSKAQLHVYYAKDPEITAPISKAAGNIVTILIFGSDDDRSKPVTGFSVSPNGSLVLKHSVFTGLMAMINLHYHESFVPLFWYGKYPYGLDSGEQAQTLYVEPASI